MKKSNRKYSIMILLSLAVILINLSAFLRRSGKIAGTQSARIEGIRHYNDTCRHVTLEGRHDKQLPDGRETLIIAFNRESMEEIDELIVDFTLKRDDVAVFLVKNNLPFFLPHSRIFYKIEDMNWLSYYGLSKIDDFILLVDRENRIRYLDNFSIGHRKIRLLLSRYKGDNA